MKYSNTNSSRLNLLVNQFKLAKLIDSFANILVLIILVIEHLMIVNKLCLSACIALESFVEDKWMSKRGVITFQNIVFLFRFFFTCNGDK